MTQTNDPPLISSLELIPDAAEKADLDAPSGSGGKLVIGQAPNITITETTVVADAAERLALDVQEGDIAVQTNVSSSFIFTGGDNIAPNWQIIDFDAVGGISGEDISPDNITALGQLSGQSLSVSGAINGADTSAAAAGEALTSDGSGSLQFASLSGSQVVKDGSAIEYVALNVSNLPASTGSGDVALVTGSDQYVEFTPILGTPFDITSSEFSLETNLDTKGTDAEDLAWNDDGTQLYEVDNQFNTSSQIHQYTLSEPFDVSTASLSTSISSQDTFPRGIAWNDDGTRLYELGTNSENIYQYTVSTSYDIDTASFQTNIACQSGSSGSITWNNDGSKLYEAGGIFDPQIYQYNVSTPFDIATALVQTSINGQGPNPTGIAFNDDGSKFYEADPNTDLFYQFILSTPFDLTTASLTNQISTDPPDDNPHGIAWNNDGTKFYFVGQRTSKFYQYTTSSGGWEAF